VCARMLVEATDGAADRLDFKARARHLRRALGEIRDDTLDGALAGLEHATGRERFTALARGVCGLDAGEAARYPHEQTAADVKRLESALASLRAGNPGDAARHLSRVGLNRLCSDLGRDAFRREHARRGRDAPRACWAAQGDPDTGPDLWEELAALRRERGARDSSEWVEQSVERHLAVSRAELERRLAAMASAVSGTLRPLPQPRPSDIPQPADG
jgi:hypothetical protein